MVSEGAKEDSSRFHFLMSFAFSALAFLILCLNLGVRNGHYFRKFSDKKIINGNKINPVEPILLEGNYF